MRLFLFGCVIIFASCNKCRTCDIEYKVYKNGQVIDEIKFTNQEVCSRDERNKIEKRSYVMPDGSVYEGDVKNCKLFK